MKIEDLRIGNYYQSTKFQIPVKCEMSDIMEICLIADGTIPSEKDVGSLFQPIKLTEQWLIDLGFNCKNEQLDYHIWEIDIMYEDYYIEVINWKDIAIVQIEDISIGCKYVHNLQNLYHSLTGRELTKK